MNTLREMSDDVVEKLLGAKPKLGFDERAFLERTLAHWQGFAAKQGNSGEGRALRAEGLHRVAKLQAKLGNNEQALAGYSDAVAIREALVIDFPSEVEHRHHLAESYTGMGRVLERYGRRPEAKQHDELALAIRDRLVAQYPNVPDYRRDLAESHSNLSDLCQQLSQWDEANVHVQAAIAAYGLLVVDFPTEFQYRENLACMHANFGLLLRNQRRYPDAEKEYKSALSSWDQLARDFPNAKFNRENLANCHDNFGVCLGEMRQLRDALVQSRLALEIRKQLAAEFPGMPSVRIALARNYDHVGGMLAQSGEAKQGQQYLQKAIEIEERLAEDYPAEPYHRFLLSASCCNIGAASHAAGARPSETLLWYDKAIGLLAPIVAAEPRLGDARILLCKSHWNRADALSGLGRFEEALVSRDKALEFSQPPERLRLRALRAATVCHAGRPAEAVAEIESLTAADEWTGPQLYDFACIYSVASDKDEGKKEEYARRAVELLGRAVSKGFTDAATFARDTDLDPLRQRADFKRLTESLPKSKGPAPRIPTDG